MHADLLDDSSIICMKGNDVHVQKKKVFINLLIFFVLANHFFSFKAHFLFLFFLFSSEPEFQVSLF